MQSTVDQYDVCIVGAGPGGLAALSAILEPYSLDHLSEAQSTRAATAVRNGGKRQVPKICVVDPKPWMNTWHKRFKALGIKWLRSPTAAHPDLFDPRAMFAYAVTHGREKELYDSGVLNPDLKHLPESHHGLWSLPSNSLFEDFCSDLASRLPHSFICSKVTSVTGQDGNFTVKTEEGEMNCGTVVLALGVPGLPAVPSALADVPKELMFHSDYQLGARLKELKKKQKVLVVGGGLTAIQVAQLAIKKGCTVTLCSRRQVSTRHFDVNYKWFDRRVAHRHHYEFFEKPLPDRLKHIRESRGGGSVPPMYMSDIRASEAAGELKLVCGQLKLIEVGDDAVDIAIDDEVCRFDKIVNACGHAPDCKQIPLLNDLLGTAPTEVVGGFPVLTEDLQWGDFKKLFVIGALASLQVGPDAGNLMGLRRAAHIVADAMGRRLWLKEVTTVLGNIRGNRFRALDSDSESDSSSDTESDVVENSDSDLCNRNGNEIKKTSTGNSESDTAVNSESDVCAPSSFASETSSNGDAERDTALKGDSDPYSPIGNESKKISNGEVAVFKT